MFGCCCDSEPFVYKVKGHAGGVRGYTPILIGDGQTMSSWPKRLTCAEFSLNSDYNIYDIPESYLDDVTRIYKDLTIVMTSRNGYTKTRTGSWSSVFGSTTTETTTYSPDAFTWLSDWTGAVFPYWEEVSHTITSTTEEIVFQLDNRLVTANYSNKITEAASYTALEAILDAVDWSSVPASTVDGLYVVPGNALTGGGGFTSTYPSTFPSGHTGVLGYAAKEAFKSWNAREYRMYRAYLSGVGSRCCLQKSAIDIDGLSTDWSYSYKTDSVIAVTDAVEVEPLADAFTVGADLIYTNTYGFPGQGYWDLSSGDYLVSRRKIIVPFTGVLNTTVDLGDYENRHHRIGAQLYVPTADVGCDLLPAP